jgi:hypothetical protein
VRETGRLLSPRSPATGTRAYVRDVRRSRSVATALTPDHDLIAAPFADSHITTMISTSISPIIVVTISTIVTVLTIIAAFTLTPAVGSNTHVQLGERDRRLGRARITSGFGACRESPHCASSGGSDKRQFSHSNLLLCDTTNVLNTRAAYLFVPSPAVTDI